MLPSVDVQSTTEPYQEIANDLDIDNAKNCLPDNDCDNSTKFVASSISRFTLYGTRALIKKRCWETPWDFIVLSVHSIFDNSSIRTLSIVELTVLISLWFNN